MRLLSLNVGRPNNVAWHRKTVQTSIWKSPVEGRLRVTPLNFDGDEQSDLTVHGGTEKAVYVYPSEHYQYWRDELQLAELPPGAFGENLTTEGLLEFDVRLGDRFGIGSAEFIVTQPRMPCYKLGTRFGRDDMVKRFLASGRTGFYLAVLKQGEVGSGDAITLLARDERAVSISDTVSLYVGDIDDPDLLRRAVAAPRLPEGWKEEFRKLIN